MRKNKRARHSRGGQQEHTNEAQTKDPAEIMDEPEIQEQEEGTASADAAAGAPEAVEAIQEELEKERAHLERAATELQSLRDRHLRLAAEFDNYRKRTDRERSESWTHAQAQIIEQLLDPLDDLERVAEQDADKTSVEALLEGVQLVRRKLMRVLESAGLEVIQADGEEFDPELHEALMMVPAAAAEDDNVVAQVFQKGYRFKGTLLRPARVQVKRYEG